MNEIECARCGWNWIMFEGQAEADCPFCPREPGGFVFVTETQRGVLDANVFPNSVRKGHGMSSSQLIGSVIGGPRMLLRLEGLVLFAASIAVFAAQGQDWWIYPALLFVPDIFMLGYLRNTKFGSILYNLGHSYPAAALVTAVGFIFGSALTVALGAIWFGHIGLDRMLGYGLKYGKSFKHTHLGDLDKPKK